MMLRNQEAIEMWGDGVGEEEWGWGDDWQFLGMHLKNGHRSAEWPCYSQS